MCDSLTTAGARTSHGATTVCSDTRPECHAPANYRSSDYSGSNGARDVQRDMILAFWESQGMARWQGDIQNGGGSRWYVRDNAQGAANWLPLARRDDEGKAGRSDRAEFSHVVSAVNGGAWCACNLVAEAGAVNANRGDEDMSADALSPAWEATLAAWPMWWKENRARKASLARLAKVNA